MGLSSSNFSGLNVFPPISVRDVITEFREIFVPIYEGKCYSHKEKVAVARVDAITG